MRELLAFAPRHFGYGGGGVVNCLICGEPVDPTIAGALVQRFASESLSDAAYCPKHAGAARTTKSRPRPFRLTREERAAIFAGEHPRLERDPKDHELAVGEIVDLSSAVWIAISRKGKNKRGQVQYRYTVHDQRLDRPHLLRRNPPAHRAEGEREVRVLDPASEALAAEESAYTSSNRNAVEHEPEAVSDMERRALAMAARLRRAESSTPEESFEGQAKSFSDAIRGIGRKAVRSGVDAGVLLAPLLREFEQRVDAALTEDEQAA